MKGPIGAAIGLAVAAGLFSLAVMQGLVTVTQKNFAKTDPVGLLATSIQEVQGKTTAVSLMNYDSTNELKAALFVQNLAGEELNSSISAFRSRITSGLAKLGVDVVDGHDTTVAFKESLHEVDKNSEDLKQEAKRLEFAKSESISEGAFLGASALRIAQMLDANHLIIASINSAETERKAFKGEGTFYKNNSEVVVRRIRASVKLLDGQSGATLVGESAESQVILGGNQALDTASDGIDNNILTEVADQLALKLDKEIASLKERPNKVGLPAEFQINTNVSGATVALDGAVVGSAPGRFITSPGLHQISVFKERYATWKNTVNITSAQNQVIAVTLERSALGDERNENELRVNREDELIRRSVGASLEIAKEQSAADAFSKRSIAEGENELRKNSHTKIEGPVDELNIGTKADPVVRFERE